MTDTNDADFLKDLKALIDQAPEGPWHIEITEIGDGPDRRPVGVLKGVNERYLAIDEDPNLLQELSCPALSLAEAAKNDVPQLIEMVEDRDRELKLLGSACDKIRLDASAEIHEALAQIAALKQANEDDRARFAEEFKIEWAQIDAAIKRAEKAETELSDAVKQGWKAAFDCITDCLANWRQDLKTQAQRDGFDSIAYVLPEMRRQSPDEYLGTLWLGVEDALKARGERDAAIKRAEQAEEEARDLRNQVANWAQAAADYQRERDIAITRAEKAEALDRAAAKHVESVICMRTGFTGEEPYVGWKGLGLALNEALDKRDAALAQVDALKDVLVKCCIPLEAIRMAQPNLSKEVLDSVVEATDNARSILKDIS